MAYRPEFRGMWLESENLDLAIVGAGICDAGGSMGRALMALGDVKIHMMSLSATGINLTVIVDGDVVNPAIKRLHAEFFPGDKT